jgi:hypothetical protein
MTITVDIRPEVQAELARQAAGRPRSPGRSVCREPARKGCPSSSRSSKRCREAKSGGKKKPRRSMRDGERADRRCGLQSQSLHRTPGRLVMSGFLLDNNIPSELN